jgi:LmbE family N-acetylglucosaminyl deacetylase
MENWFLPFAASPLPPARQVLVLAPHPDDEVFGCGGCASLYARAGAVVHPYVLTDGGGYLTGPSGNRSWRCGAKRASAPPPFWARRHRYSAPGKTGDWASRPPSHTS